MLITMPLELILQQFKVTAYDNKITLICLSPGAWPIAQCTLALYMGVKYTHQMLKLFKKIQNSKFLFTKKCR